MTTGPLIRTWLWLPAALLLALSCSGNGRLQKTTETGLHELSTAGELVTCEYTVSKVIKADDMVPWKIGERKILFCCNAYLKGGVDMTTYNPAKTVIDPGKKSIILVLPPPKILSINIPAEEVRQVYSHVTGLRADFSAEERNRLLQQGEEAILLDVPQMGIIPDARRGAVAFFESFLRRLGYEDINIYFDVL